MRTIYWSSIDSTVGLMYIASTEKGVCRITLPGQSKKDFMDWVDRQAKGGVVKESPARHRKIADELDRYFNRKLVRFQTRFDLIGTPFQKKVWRELKKVTYGTTISYGQLAERIGDPAASRSVGHANGANPLPIVYPCHRIIGSNGDLVGYGGGVKMKEFLLRLEGALLL